jgi:hypothetical protein
MFAQEWVGVFGQNGAEQRDVRLISGVAEHDYQVAPEKPCLATRYIEVGESGEQLFIVERQQFAHLVPPDTFQLRGREQSHARWTRIETVVAAVEAILDIGAEPAGYRASHLE